MSNIQIASKIKDSGERQSFETGSRRDTRSGKGRFDLLPVLAMTRLARHFESGAIKYNERNWEKGQPLGRYMDSALRHAFKYLAGMRDEDHLIAACWNLMCLAETETKISLGLLPKELNDLPEIMNEETISKIEKQLFSTGETKEKEDSRQYTFDFVKES